MNEAEHDSTPADDPEKVRAAWKAELIRRIEEIDSGKIVATPIDEMFRLSREKYP